MGEPDRRGLTPLFTSNMIPYGDIQLHTNRRLALGGVAEAPARSWSELGGPG